MNRKIIIIAIALVSITLTLSVTIFYSYTGGHPLCVIEIKNIVDSQKNIISPPENQTSGLFEVVFDDPVQQEKYEKLVDNCKKIILNQ